MIIFKIITLALKDIDRHQVQITNMSNLREREREMPTTMLFLCKHINFFMERQREKLKTIEKEYVMYKGPLIKLCYIELAFETMW